ncbi:MAG: hypothetical protein JWQ22_2566 [Devosia sp.]|nr:hypothetical protein [Devosia sp.]
MTAKRIAVLLDAENIDCVTAVAALKLLVPRGMTQIKRAVGDFSLAALNSWIACGRENGIELVLQPGLGKGKNSADIRLTIEAMDVVHQRTVDAVALVTHDGDFTPLALRLRNAGLEVMGFSRVEPNAAFRSACTSFEVLGIQAAPTQAALSTKQLSARKQVETPANPKSPHSNDTARLRQVVAEACESGPVRSAALRAAINLAEPDLLRLLGGKGKFQKSLVAHGLVQIVGSGAEQRLQPVVQRRA